MSRTSPKPMVLLLRGREESKDASKTDGAPIRSVREERRL